MPTTATRCADPALVAVRAEKSAVRDAEVRLLLRVLDWALERTTDADPHTVTFGERPLMLGGIGCPVIEEFAAYDLTAALGMSTDSGLAYLARALELRHRLPRLWAAVTSGRLSVWKAGRIADATMALPVDGADFVDGRLGQAVSTISFAQVDRLVQEALARLDPDQAPVPETRHVHIDGQRVEAVLDLPDALDLDDALRAGATRLADAGCDKTLDVRRSIALGDLARGDHTLPLSAPGRDLVVHLHQDSPQVARCETTRTPITVEQVQTWCNTFTKVVIKPVIDLNDHVHVDAYEAPDRLRDQITLRDLHCVFPNCTRPARGCDLDHITPYDTGGPTASDNLAPLCRRHHRAKTHSTWHYDVIEPGTYHWTSPSGLTYRRDHRGTHPLDDPAEP